VHPRRRQKVRHPARQELADSRASAGGLWSAVHRFLSRDVWLPELTSVGWLRARALKVARVTYLTARGFVLDNCLFRASGLTYITVLSLVPLLAFSFSIAKGFGGYETLREEVVDPFLDRVVPESEGAPTSAPAGGPEAEGTRINLRETIEIVFDTVEKTDFAKLGLFGLAILLYTVVKLIGAVERALNDIWGVPRSRSVVRKVSDYLTMVVVTPIFLLAGLGLFTVSQTESALAKLREAYESLFGQTEGLDTAIDSLVAASPFFVIWVGLTLLYLAIPNTRVRLGSATLGGMFGAALTISALIGHSEFQIGVARANKIYAGFAAVPIFLFFVYLLWVAVLLGAELAAAHQSEPAFRTLALARPTDPAARERIALRALVRVGAAFSEGRGPVEVGRLAGELGLPTRTLDDVLETLEQHDLLIATEVDGEPAWVPGRQLSDLRIADVLDALREPVENELVRSAGAMDRLLEEKLSGLADAVRSARDNATLEELLAELDDAELEPAEKGASDGSDADLRAEAAG